MSELKPCPLCGVPPTLAYCCGEYMVYGEHDDCPYCGVAFTEMHSSEELEIEAWNRRVDISKEFTTQKDDFSKEGRQ